MFALFSTRSGILAAFLLVLLGPAPAVPARADDNPLVQKGLEFLRARIPNQQVGESALIALAMIKAGVPEGDPDLNACVAKIRSRYVSGVYQPERASGPAIYETGVVCLALANLDAESRRAELQAAAQYLLGRQNANGSWDYSGRTQGDTSISQYAVLGLWEAENGGADVPPEVWDHAAEWYMSSQHPTFGSWNYHRDEPVANPETISMTAAGVGSLLICQRQLARFRRGTSASNPFLQPLLAEGVKAPYDVATSNARLEQSIKRGLAWLGANFTSPSAPTIGPSAYYGLYGIERIGALAERDTIGRVNWFDLGRQFIASSQRTDGAWVSTHGEIPNTVWAILFITKSTAKSLRKIEIKRLGAGTLLGGRFLPKDLSSMTVAGGRVVSRPMNGAVEGMLGVLEDPRAEDADGPGQGPVARYRAEGPKALRPHKDRFRKLAADRDPGLRRVAAWALARTGDLDVVPNLLGLLVDRDESVVSAAREGLQLISRKVDGFGPPSPSTPDQRRDAARRWQAWYASIRPLDLEGQDERPLTGAGDAVRSPR